MNTRITNLVFLLSLSLLPLIGQWQSKGGKRIRKKNIKEKTVEKQPKATKTVRI